MKIIAILLLNLGKSYERLLMHFYKSLFRKCGKNVIFFPTCSKFFYKNISIGNYVSIGYGADFSASRSQITIGDNTIIASNVTIRGGRHSTNVIGKLMVDYQNNDKIETDDEDVIIDDDVLVNIGAIILKGVHIFRGAVILAGAIVTANVPPYAIVSGSPAKIIKYRWSQKEILQHEEIVYPQTERLPIELLKQQ